MRYVSDVINLIPRIVKGSAQGLSGDGGGPQAAIFLSSRSAISNAIDSARFPRKSLVLFVKVPIYYLEI